MQEIFPLPYKIFANVFECKLLIVACSVKNIATIGRKLQITIITLRSQMLDVSISMRDFTGKEAIEKLKKPMKRPQNLKMVLQNVRAKRLKQKSSMLTIV